MLINLIEMIQIFDDTAQNHKRKKSKKVKPLKELTGHATKSFDGILLGHVSC